ncbi:MAG: O-antigen ligase family protein [Neisseria sp.]|nr:O-antigen ligase family protein [Neisseria sp.]
MNTASYVETLEHFHIEGFSEISILKHGKILTVFLYRLLSDQAMKKINLDGNILLAWAVGLAYAAGALNTLVLAPTGTFLPNTDSLIVLSLGLGLSLWWRPVRLSLNLSAKTWLALIGVLLLQLVFYRFDYADSLFFVLVTLGLMLLLSVYIYTIDNKQLFMRHLMYGILLVGVINASIQYFQLFNPATDFYPLIRPLASGNTPYGNVAQRNEASYINAMALVALLYVTHIHYAAAHFNKKFLLIGFTVLLFLLGGALGMGSSRIGAILPLVAIPGFMLMQQGLIKDKFFRLCAVLVLYLTAYFFGVWLLQAYGLQTIADRIIHGEFNTRWSLWQQSLMIFLDSPLLGSGWGTYAHEGIEKSGNLLWFAYSTHSHFLFSQIGAELGVLGLLALMPAGLSVLRATRLKLSLEYAGAWSIAVVTLLYSCTEYPLWYVRYLCIFVAVLAFLDTRTQSQEDVVTSAAYPLARLLGLVSVLLSLTAVYYHIQYRQIANVFLYLQASQTNTAEDFELYEKLPNPYGLSYAQEVFLFSILPTSTDKIEEKTTLGKRVSSHILSREILFKQGVFLTLNRQPEQANNYFKASCAINYGKECDQTRADLRQLSNDYPEIFQAVKQLSEQW